jgi:hypothetical protein
VRRMNSVSACHVTGNPIKIRADIVRSARKYFLMVADKTEPLIGSEPVTHVQAERLVLLPVAFGPYHSTYMPIVASLYSN